MSAERKGFSKKIKIAFVLGGAFLALAGAHSSREPGPIDWAFVAGKPIFLEQTYAEGWMGYEWRTRPNPAAPTNRFIRVYVFEGDISEVLAEATEEVKARGGKADVGEVSGAFEGKNWVMRVYQGTFDRIFGYMPDGSKNITVFTETTRDETRFGRLRRVCRQWL